MAQRSEMIPVHILSGFLGSGKTTLLKRWLAGQQLDEVAILVNEFGEVGIDHHLLGEVAPDTVLLPGGCVCCQIRGELKDALLDLCERRSRGTLPPFRQLILETTGLAEPAPILSTLLHDSQLKHHFLPGVIVTLVDGEHADAHAAHPEWLGQVAAADTLAIGKSDRISPAACERLAHRLRRLNPLAELAITADLLHSPDRLFAVPAERATRRRLLYRPAATTARSAATLASPTPVHRPAARTCTIEIEEKLDWSAFAIWLSLLLHRHGKAILRMKGILRINDSDDPVILQGVQHVLHPPEHLRGGAGAITASRLVFIMRGLSVRQLKRSFAQFHATMKRKNDHGESPRNP